MENGEVFFDDIVVVGDGTVKANTAYLFDPAKDIASITVQNPVFTNGEADAISSTGFKTKLAGNDEVKTVNNVFFDR